MAQAAFSNPAFSNPASIDRNDSTAWLARRIRDALVAAAAIALALPPILPFA